MKKFVSLLLVLCMALSLCACSLFSDESVVQFEELYTHKDPDGLKYDERKVMINDSFGATLEESINAAAYPSNVKMDDEGNMIGIYDYDPTTGMASGYTDFTTGKFVAEEVELGLPDESLMVHFAGNVTLGSVIYGKDGTAVDHCLYAFLENAADKDLVSEWMFTFFNISMEAESDTVLVCKEDENDIRARFDLWQELYGQIQSDRSANGYADNLKLDLGLRNYGVNPYAPTSAMLEEVEIEYDTMQILTSAGGYSFVDTSLEADMVGRTDVIYGLGGKVVGHYVYYEYKDKAGADKLMENESTSCFAGFERLSDTVILDKIVGEDLESILNAYIGYNVLSDDSFDAYVTNAEESFFLMRYDG